MTNVNSHISLSYLNRILLQSVIVASLSTIGLLCGLAPDLSSRSPNLIFSSSAFALAVSDDEVIRFARSAKAIEIRRQAVVQQIKGAVPETTCAAVNANTPNEVKEFCDFSRQTIEANQLTVGRFEQIRNAMKTDPALKARIDAILNGI